MTLTTTTITQDFSIAPQISEDDVAEAARLGFKTIINNRPDFEGGEAQPTSHSIEAAALAAGLSYFYIPVIPNAITPEQIQTFKHAFQAAEKPVLGFCRTGNRATKILELALSQQT